MENSLNTRNDELVLLYIEHAIKNLNDASVNLEKSFINDKIKYPELITDAIIDGEWNYYLISSIILNAQETITVKIWFNEIVKITRCINRSSMDSRDIRELQARIISVLNDQALLAVREKLFDAVNQKRS